MKKFVMIVLLMLMTLPSTWASDPAPANPKPEAKVETVIAEKTAAQLQAELENLKLDRNNILKQAQSFQKEKNDLLAKIEEMKNASSGATTELGSLKKEVSILNTEVEKLKQARAKDRELYEEEKGALNRKLKEETDKSASLAKTLEEYTPEKITSILEDRTRLEKENQSLAVKLTDSQKKVDEIQRNMTPLELDRQELHKIQEENQELRERTKYIQKQDARITQLIKENKEYREELEVARSKFKDAVPGLAKSGRLAQKMMRENAQMHYNLGTIFLQNKRYKEAITEYEKALELMPNDPDSHYNLGVLYDDFLKDREKALYHYQKYLAVNPKAPDAKKVESYILNMELEQKVR